VSDVSRELAAMTDEQLLETVNRALAVRRETAATSQPVAKTPAEEFSDFLGLTPSSTVSDPAPDPGPRTPRPDPSQGHGQTTAEVDPVAFFHSALHRTPGPAGVAEAGAWAQLARLI
jgi:hypothetical protein